MTVPSACHRCRTPLAAGNRAWRMTAEEGNRGWLCLACGRAGVRACGRAFAAGRPGASAELEAMRRMRAEPVLAAARPTTALRVAPRFLAPGGVDPAMPLPPRGGGDRRATVGTAGGSQFDHGLGRFVTDGGRPGGASAHGADRLPRGRVVLGVGDRPAGRGGPCRLEVAPAAGIDPAAGVPADGGQRCRGTSPRHRRARALACRRRRGQLGQGRPR
jgi:hypothetical protein